MRSRGLVVAIAIVLAIVAAAAVILYTNQVRQNALGDEATQVVVATQDIPAGTRLDTLIEQGAFETIQVPNGALVEDAVQGVEELRGATTTAPILAREQISASRLNTGQAVFSTVGVSDGKVGLTVTLAAERAGAGAVQIGDYITIYATFPRDTVVLKSSLKQILTPAQFQKFVSVQENGATPSQIASLPAFVIGTEFTTTLVRSARVIQISNPPVDETGRSENGDITLMLDLEPDQAEAVVFAKETAQEWIGLLPPKNKDGYPVEAWIGARFDLLVGQG